MHAHADLAARRVQLAHAQATMLGIDGAVAEVRPGSWLALSGERSADMNWAWIHERDDPELELARALERVDRVDRPTLLMLAGECRDLGGRLPGGWQTAGEVPAMSIDLRVAPRAPDGRVRRARTSDADAVVGLLAEAYEIEPPLLVAMVDRILAGGLRTSLWVLQDGDEVVSAVVVARVGDSVSL